MKISCTRENLHQGLSIVGHLTTKNVNLPILQNILMKAEGGSIRLTATNLEIAIHAQVRGKVDETGELTVPSKLFADYVNLLPNETVQMESEGETMKVTCGSSKTKLKGLPASEFPLVPDVQTGRAYKIPVAEFKHALSRTLFAVANNESRPELTGIFLQFKKGEGESKLILAATDSYRLAEGAIPLITPVEQEDSVIIPARTLAEVSRILGVFKDDVESPSFVELHLSDTQVVFRYGTVELVSRIIDGRYPPYTQIIPKEFQTEAYAVRSELLQAVKAAALFSRNGLFDVSFTFEPDENRVSIAATDATRGEHVIQVPVTMIGRANTVTLNYRYVIDGLNAVGSEDVCFQMIDAANPCLVSPKGEVSYRYVIMPIRQ